MIALAVVCALAGASLFALAATRQHDAVRALGQAALTGLIRSREWWIGTSLAVGGSALHLVALALAPLPIVQPLGVFSLVLTVVFTGRARIRRVRWAVAMVCAGVCGFVALAAAQDASAAPITPGTTQAVVAVGVVLAAAVWFVRGRCVALSAAAAVLFGLGSAVVHAAAQQPLGVAALLAAEGLLVLAAGGVVLHRAYAAGPAAVVVGATTVLDPATAVAVAALAYGEAPRIDWPFAVLAALLAVSGVLVLAGAVPDPQPKEPIMPAPASGLRILIGADTFPPDVNGASFFAGRLALGLARRGHDVHVLCPDAGGPEPGEYTVHRVRSLPVPLHRGFRFCTPARARRAAGPLLDRLRPDVVHVQAHFGVCRALLAAAAERGIPTMATNHFMPENLLGYTPFPRGVRDRLARWAWRDLVRVYRDARVVTTPTPRAADLLARIGLPAPVRVISCGIDLDHYAAPARSAAESVSVLFVGRLDAEKNIDQLVRAIAPLPNVRADLVGDGTRRDELAALARTLGIADRVTFHGLVPDADLVRRYAAADVFCMPGTAELQSIATMEAMAAGLPIVAADAMALPHLVAHGVNGYLFEPGSVTTLTRWIAELAADPEARGRMGQASRELVARHDIQATLAAYEAEYRALVPSTVDVLVP